MSDLILVVPSTFYATYPKLLKLFPRWGEWYVGETPDTLQKFLDTHLNNMIYDEEHHIITAVNKVELETRCPYLHGQHEDHPKFCHDCGKEHEKEEMTEAEQEINKQHDEKTYVWGKTRPWWICKKCWVPVV